MEPREQFSTFESFKEWFDQKTGELLLAKLYKFGLLKEDDYEGMKSQVERTVGGTTPGYQGFSWQEILYESYCATHPQQSL